MSPEHFDFADTCSAARVFSPISADITQTGSSRFNARVTALVDGALQEQAGFAATRFLAVCNALHQHVPELKAVSFSPPNMVRSSVTGPGEVGYMHEGVRRHASYDAWTPEDAMAGALDAAVRQLRAGNAKPVEAAQPARHLRVAA